jgi:uncharacterized protein (DUF1778 family)
MIVTNPRYRVVTFRLSASEYASVYAAAEMRGARSMSDFARAAVLARAAEAPAAPETDQLRALNLRSEQVMQILLELDQRIRGVFVAATEKES